MKKITVTIDENSYIIEANMDGELYAEKMDWTTCGVQKDVNFREGRKPIDDLFNEYELPDHIMSAAYVLMKGL